MREMDLLPGQAFQTSAGVIPDLLYLAGNFLNFVVYLFRIYLSITLDFIG
jgi:hypothetical protein